MGLLRSNSVNPFELVEIVDNHHACKAYDTWLERATGDIVVFTNDDMFVAPGWNQHLVTHASPKPS